MEWNFVKYRMPEPCEFPIAYAGHCDGAVKLGAVYQPLYGGVFADWVELWASLPKLPDDNGDRFTDHRA